MINETLLRFFNGFHHDAHPMAMVSAVVASMSAFYHDSMDINNPRHREIFAHRIIAKMPTIAAAAYKHIAGPAVRLSAQRSGLLRATCCTCSSRCLPSIRGRSRRRQGAGPAVDPACRPRAECQHVDRAPRRQHGRQPLCGDFRRRLGALGPGARRRERSRARDARARSARVDNIQKFLAKVKDKDDNVRLMGFGHRVYKNFDPRAKIIREMCHKVLDAAGPDRQPAVRAGVATRRDRAQGRILRRPQAVSERRFLFRRHLQRARHPALDVHGHVRDRPHRRLGRALAGNDRRSGA